MMSLRRILLCLSVLALPAAAQDAEFGISAGFAGFSNDFLGTNPNFGTAPTEFNLNNGFRVGGRMAFNWSGFLGHELAYAYQRGGIRLRGDDGEGAFSEQDVGGISIQNFYYNLVAHATPSGTRVRPFVTGGGGFSAFFPPGASSLSGQGSTKFGYNFGGGIKFNLGKYGIRFDVRDHVTGKPFERFISNIDGQLHNIEYSATFSILF